MEVLAVVVGGHSAMEWVSENGLVVQNEYPYV